MTRAERYHAARRDPGLVVLEGFHAVKHAARFGAELLEIVAANGRSVAELADRLAPDVATLLEEVVVEIGGEALARLAPQPHPTGIMALARRPAPRVDLHDDGGAAPLVFLERPAHLGNLGAAVRVAAAAGAAGFLSSGAHDPWSPEAVRAAAGLQFALPIGQVADGFETTRPLVAITPEGESIERRPLPTNALLAFGSERHGLDAALRRRADRRVAIPMTPGVSSLNVATAVAVTLYWWRLAPPPADAIP